MNSIQRKVKIAWSQPKCAFNQLISDLGEKTKGEGEKEKEEEREKIIDSATTIFHGS